jgi:SAM-dependent methyltransferase
MGWLKPHFPGLDLDSPETTRLHRQLIRSKPLLRNWYEIQYRKYLALIGDPKGGLHVELGSGGGFLKEIVPAVTTSSILEEDKRSGLVDLRLNAQAMELADASVDSFFMLDVMHHLNDARACLRELDRCLKPGGVAFIVEPANSLVSRFIYKNFHHEDFDETSPNWGHAHQATLAQSNQAIPSIIFERDRAVFEREFPRLKIAAIRKHTFLSYLLSGGLSYEPLLPPWAQPSIPWIEKIASPAMPCLAHYMDVHLVKAR